MPSLLDIRRRIRSVKNTQQLTKAMKTVSAAKLRRAQERVVSARPYAQQLQQRAGQSRRDASKTSRIRCWKSVPRRRILAARRDGDRGLCGAFNSNIIEGRAEFLARASRRRNVSLYTGRPQRPRFFQTPQHADSSASSSIFSRKLDCGSCARTLRSKLIELYTKAEVDAVYLVYNEFKSVIQQRIAVEKLLPLGSADLQERQVRRSTTFSNSRRRRFSIGCCRAMWRSRSIGRCWNLLPPSTAPAWPRWTRATRNAGEMIDLLTLNMNRVRQAAITREIIEVVSGAGA